MTDEIVKTDTPPPRPLLIWDGDCGFCGRWVERWREMGGEHIDFVPYQEVGRRFPEIAPSDFAEAVHLVEPDGRISHGADAVFRATEAMGRSALPRKAYERSGAVRRITDLGYRLVARNRFFFSSLTRIAMGRDLRPSTYRLAGWLFPKAYGLVALMAFLSFWVQAEGLIGSNGILPAADFLERVETVLGEQEDAPDPVAQFPTLFWITASDTAIHGVCALGVLACIGLVAGLAPPLMVALIGLLYLSILTVGQDFMTFQWDILLVETAVILTFFAPWRWLNLRPASTPEPSRLARWLLWLLLFKLMFQSGIVKLQSYGPLGENTWRDLTALDFHYWTQPIPSWTSWHIHQLPHWVDATSLIVMMVIELALPFLFFAPRRIRAWAAIAQVGLQLLIIASGNYGFFNYLTAALCIPLFADQILPARWRTALCIPGRAPPEPRRWLTRTRRVVLIPIAIILVSMAAFQLWVSVEDTREERRAFAWLKEQETLAAWHDRLSRFRVSSGYGLFRVMTTTRPEIRIEGSRDGVDWRLYVFPYKPDDPARRPPWIAPGHMPRLDWRMWFAGLNVERQVEFIRERLVERGIENAPPATYARNLRLPGWLNAFIGKLMEGSPEVLALLEENPFPEDPPEYFRISLARYSFTTPQEKAEAGAYWKVEPVPEFVISGRFRR